MVDHLSSVFLTREETASSYTDSIDTDRLSKFMSVDVHRDVYLCNAWPVGHCRKTKEDRAYGLASCESLLEAGAVSKAMTLNVR